MLYTSAQVSSLRSHSYTYCCHCLSTPSRERSDSYTYCCHCLCVYVCEYKVMACDVWRVPCGVYSDVVSSRHEELERSTQSAEMALDLEMENSGAVYTEPCSIASLLDPLYSHPTRPALYSLLHPLSMATLLPSPPPFPYTSAVQPPICMYVCIHTYIHTNIHTYMHSPLCINNKYALLFRLLFRVNSIETALRRRR